MSKSKHTVSKPIAKSYARIASFATFLVRKRGPAITFTVNSYRRENSAFDLVALSIVFRQNRSLSQPRAASAKLYELQNCRLTIIMIAIIRNVIANVIKPQICKPAAKLDTFLKSEFCKKPQVSEQEILAILKQKFPSAKEINVEDVSGGCGAMFNVFIETPEFKGQSIVKQHRSVYDILKVQIENIHGIHLETKVPK